MARRNENRSVILLASAAIVTCGAVLPTRESVEPQLANSRFQPQVADAQEENRAVRQPVEAQRPMNRRVLVMLKSRRHVVTVYSGVGRPEGQRYKVSTLDGEVLADGLGMGDFQVQFPTLYEFYRTSFAEAWAGTDFSVEPRTGGR